MRLRDAAALVLEVIDLQERDRIVGFLTAEHGLRRGVARGARTKYSRFAGQLQPLARVRVRWVEKEGRDLVRISEVELERPAAPLQRDLEGILLGAYLAEQMSVFAQENEESARLFRLLDSTLAALLAGAPRELAARYYETWMLRLAGIFPPPRDCPHCGRELAERAVFVDVEGALVCTDCAALVGGGGRRGVATDELVFLLRSRIESLETMARQPPAPATLRRVEELCAAVRRSFLGHELRSYEVMRRTLAGLG